MDDSAQDNRPSFNVEEVPSTQPMGEPAPISMSTETETVEIPMASPELQPVVETIPPIPHQENNLPPEAQEHIKPQTSEPFTPPPNMTNAPNPSVTGTNGLPPGGHNVGGKGHVVRKLLFLIPAVLLVATIFVVAKLTSNNYITREPEPLETPVPTEAPAEPEVSPTPEPISLKTYTNIDMLIELKIPENYEVLDEGKNEVSFGKDGTEAFIIRNTNLTKYSDEDRPNNVLLGGRKAVEVNLQENGVSVRVVQTIDEPKYEFVIYLDESEMTTKFQDILDSVVFLVDTTDWETFDNTTYNYTISYPPDWEQTTDYSEKKGTFGAKTEISRDPENKELNTLVIQSSANVDNAALTASEIISSTRTLSGWISPPSIMLRKLGGGDAQGIQGELTGKWRAYVVIWYKNNVIQMTWEDAVERPYQQAFENILASFEFTN